MHINKWLLNCDIFNRNNLCINWLSQEDYILIMNFEGTSYQNKNLIWNSDVNYEK